jgi:hypothetical protein
MLSSSPVIFGMRMSAIRHESWLIRLDCSRLATRANTAAEWPADGSSANDSPERDKLPGIAQTHLHERVHSRLG